MKYKACKLASLCTAAVSAAILLATCVSAEDTNVLNVDSVGYYDVTATFSNTSVDGSCYMWARSSMSTEGTAVLPKSTDTSGTEIIIRGIYTADGKIEYGLSNDGKSGASISDVKAVKSKEYTFMNGGDISEYTWVHDKGGKYYSLEGYEVNPISYLGENGMNACRIRLSNDPGPGHGDGTYYLPEGYQNEEDCLRLAKQAKDAGMKIVFTFNYSDYWSNGERQRIPAKWVEAVKDSLGYDIESYDFLKSMTTAQKTQIKNKLSELIYNYTKDIMEKLAAQGTTPEYVSIGNEINGGVFIPFGGSYDSWFDPSNFMIEYAQTDSNVKYSKDFDGIAQLLNSGYDAVKEVSADTQVIVHLASDGKFQNSGYNNWWYDAYQKSGGKWDVTGISYYPSWTVQTASVCKTRVNELSSRYSKPVILMEAGFNWNPTKKDGYNGQLYNIDAYKDIYPDSQSGHKGFMTELTNYMRLADNCIGILYWDPLMIHVEDENGSNLVGWAIEEGTNEVQTNVVENTTLFDFDGRATATVGMYRDTKNAQIISTTIDKAYINDNGNVSVDISYPFEAATDIFTALYDENGRLVEIDKTRCDSQRDFHVEWTVDTEVAHKVKLFTWLPESMNPFTKSESVEVK